MVPSGLRREPNRFQHACPNGQRTDTLGEADDTFAQASSFPCRAYLVAASVEGRIMNSRAICCAVAILAACGPAASANAQSASKWELEQRTSEAARELAAHPMLQGMRAPDRQRHVEFLVGNALFVLSHEIGHATISEMGIPVIGREEDAADIFATLMALEMSNAFADRALTNVAMGWFFSDRRNRNEGIRTSYYDEHGIDLQRAYNIVCLMVGSNPDKFAALADETQMPDERQLSCQGDYSNASWSWNKVLESHRRKPEQPRTTITVSYGPGEGAYELYAAVARKLSFLESMADMLADQYVWRAPIALEMRTCKEPTARWDLTTRKVVICYDIVAEFSQLYRAYGRGQAFSISSENDDTDVADAAVMRSGLAHNAE
jgi:hypothetical protein